MRDKPLRALGPRGRKRGAANARSKIIIMHNPLLFGEHKMQGVILIPESININLAFYCILFYSVLLYLFMMVCLYYIHFDSI